MRAFECSSQDQLAAWQRGELAAPEQVRHDIWAVAQVIPDAHLASSFGYAIFGADGVHIIDPGCMHENNLQLWQDFLASRGKSISDIVTLVSTHSHHDHIALATELRNRSGARVVVTDIEAQVMQQELYARNYDQVKLVNDFDRWGVPEHARAAMVAQLRLDRSNSVIVEPDHTLTNGEYIHLGAYNFKVVLTPGHTSGHCTLVAQDAGIIFSGDHVLPTVNPGIGLGTRAEDDAISDYYESLMRMQQYDDCEVLPGHEFRFYGLAARSEQILAHQLTRTAAVAREHATNENMTVWQLAQKLPWSRGWEVMQGFYRWSALWQTDLHLSAVTSGRVSQLLAARGL